MNNIVKLTVAATVTAVLAACGSTPEANPNANLPGFVLNPVVEDGIAVGSCVSATNNLNTDKSMAQALARTELAQTINTRVKAMDKVYQSRTDVDGKAVVGSTFEAVSKQLTDQSLSGVRTLKTEYSKDGGQLCVLLAIGSSSTKELFDNIVKESERPLSATDEGVLYQEFKAHKAQQELEAELGKNKG